jgi:hypothetical protein
MLRELPKPLDLWTDEEFIAAYGEEARTARGSRPVYLGDLQRPGWTGRIPTYLVWCAPCQYGPDQGFTVTHEAGYTRRLHCRHCRKRYDQFLSSRRPKDMLLNPHQHPWFLAFLCLAAILAAIAFH